MTGIRSVRSFVGVCVGLILWAMPIPAGAQASNSWDQGKVTSIAERLAEAAKELRVAAQKEPPDLSFSQRRAQYELNEDLRLFRNSTLHLSSELKAGKGREETWPVFRRIEQIRRDAEENARRTLISEELMEEIFGAGAVLLEIEPYYRVEKEKG